MSPELVPKRELGQHFLVDENILGVIGRLSALDAGDIVLEIGAGLGVLTAYLARRVGLVYAVEIDRSLEPRLRDALGEFENVRLLFGDAMRLPLGDLDPPATKLVANLPYAVATPILADSLDGLPELTLWCVMVQREVADRLVAAPGTKVYGAVSVLVQLTARRIGFHPVARTCFRPVPNVDSALLALERIRRWGPEYPRLKAVVQGAFAHRRKTIANALELAGVATRREVQAALTALHLPEEARAEVLAPSDYERLVAVLR